MEIGKIRFLVVHVHCTYMSLSYMYASVARIPLHHSWPMKIETQKANYAIVHADLTYLKLARPGSSGTDHFYVRPFHFIPPGPSPCMGSYVVEKTTMHCMSTVQ